MDKLLSVIIPTYNMEKYLRQCLDSVTRSDVPSELEVIVVNDGSKDLSIDIAREYEQKRSDVVVVIDKQNGNYGSCMNAGLKVANGKYIRLLDADDWFDTEALKSVLEKLKNVDADIIFTNYAEVVEGGGKVRKINSNSVGNGDVLNVCDSRLMDIDSSSDLVMHRMTIRTQLLRDNNYLQTEGISYTDTEYVFYSLRGVKSVVFFDECLYHYRVGRAGQTVSVESRVAHRSDYEKIIGRMLDEHIDDTSSIIGSWQRGYLAYVIASYYQVVLVLQHPSESVLEIMSSIDDRLYKFDVDVYNMVDEVRCMGIRYIHWWREKGCVVINSDIYKIIRKLVKW